MAIFALAMKKWFNSGLKMWLIKQSEKNDWLAYIERGLGDTKAMSCLAIFLRLGQFVAVSTNTTTEKLIGEISKRAA